MPQDLFHVSENPNISEFIPLPPPNKEAGVEGDAVWTISDKELENYMLPRDCPRICYRDDQGKKTIIIEKAWIEKINQTTLYLYKFDSGLFKEIDSIAGYWISRKSVKPKEVVKLNNLIETIKSKDINLKILDNLHDEKEHVIKNFKHFSVIRFRNAQAKK